MLRLYRSTLFLVTVLSYQRNKVIIVFRLRLKCDGTRAETRFRLNGRIHLNPWGRQFSRLLGAEVCALEVVMLDTPCSGVVGRVLATHSIYTKKKMLGVYKQ